MHLFTYIGVPAGIFITFLLIQEYYHRKEIKAAEKQREIDRLLEPDWMDEHERKIS